MRPAWTRTRKGVHRNPPTCCPSCGWGWPTDRPGRPRESWVRCWCTDTGAHTTWDCPVCGTRSAEGCDDAGQWVSSTVPVDIPKDARWGIEAWVMRGELEGWEP